MKRLLIVLVLLLSICSCSKTNYSVKMNDDTPLITRNGKTVMTVSDVANRYQFLDSTNLVLSNCIDKIAEIEGITGIEEQVQAEIDSMIESYGEQYEVLLQYYGFANAEEYTKVVRSQIAMEQLKAKYIDEHKDTFIDEYAPKRVQYVSFADEETANEFLGRVKAGEQFDAVAYEYSNDTSIQPAILTNKGTLASDIKSIIVSLPKGLSTPMYLPKTTIDEAGNSVDGYAYYVFNILEDDPSVLIDDIKDTIASNLSNGTVYAYYLQKYEFTPYNRFIYFYMEQNFPEVIK
ncbi:MAG: hypothetical protein IKE33_05110 [Erysipelotrichaceae bacterium]|nr:hypothetical protein [Erysipelotrichaceae bacterium]